MGGKLIYEFQNESQTSNGITDTDTSHKFKEQIEIKTAGWVYHPALMQYTLMIAPELTQTKEEMSPGDTTRTSAFTPDYSMTATFLEPKPYTLNIFANRLQEPVWAAFSGNTETITDSYGATGQLKYKVLPTTFGYSHNKTDQTGFYISQDIHDEFNLSSRHQTETSNTWLTRFPILSKLMVPVHKISHWLHSFSPVLAVVGLSLSLLHQASLGATYSVLAGRGLWFNQSAPVQFVLSAMGGGVALLFLVSIVVFRIMRPGLVKDDVFYDLARISGAVTLLLTYLRVWDWAVTNYYSFDREIALQTQVLDTIAPYSLTFWLGQAILPAVAGAMLLAARRIRSFRILLAAASIPILNAILMRWNFNFSGLIASITYDPFTPSVVLNSYTPTWVEFAVGGMVICYWLLMFSLAARYLPFHSTKQHEH